MNVFPLFPALLLFLYYSPVQAATFLVSSNFDSADQNPGDGICQTALVYPHNCSLKAAIQEANALGGADTIVFASPLTFYLSSSELLPTITDNDLTIDGSNQWDNGDNVPGIILSNYGTINSLVIRADNTVIKGIYFEGSGTGISLSSGTGNRIGGPNDHERNVFHGVGTGIYLGSGSTGTTIQYNYFGIRRTNINVPRNDNYVGEYGIYGAGTPIGPYTIIENNIIGEQQTGIWLGGCKFIKVRNNVIGMPAISTAYTIPNNRGIELLSTSAEITDNHISDNTETQIYISGGPSSGKAVISGNYIGSAYSSDIGVITQSDGVTLAGVANNVEIKGNYINHVNGDGVVVTVGSFADIANNTISYNDGNGIYIQGTSYINTVSGNSIFNNDKNGILLNSASNAVISANTIGSSSMGGNTLDGIRIENGSKDNIIGGVDQTAQNVIGYNGKSGIYVTGAGTTGNHIAGNIIGAGPHFYNIAVGYLKAGNGNHGIAVYDGAESNNIGLSGDIISPNIILDNTWSGIAIVNSHHNRIFSNMIGTDGASRLWGNKYYGINIVDGNNNIVKYNTITNNGFQAPARAGISIKEITPGWVNGNQMSENSIFHNGAAGIELINGANGNVQPPTLQRHGIILSGTACPGCTVEFFSGPDMDEGAFYEGSTQADTFGNYSLIQTGSYKGSHVTATATTTPGLNTSEFSLPVKGTFPWILFLQNFKKK